MKWFGHWYSWAIRSRIKPVKNFARSIKAHLSGILAHCKHKINTSFLEGMNNKIKVIKRIAFGYQDFEYFFGENPWSLSMIYLSWSVRNLIYNHTTTFLRVEYFLVKGRMIVPVDQPQW